MRKGINIIIYSVLALTILFGNMSIISFIINDKEITSMAETTSEPTIMPTETPEISYYVLVKELPVFKYNTISRNKIKDTKIRKYFYGEEIKVKESGQIYTQIKDGCYVWSNCIGNLPKNCSLSFPSPKVVVIDAGKQEKTSEETEKIEPRAAEETKIDNEMEESTLNFAIAERVKKKLEEDGYIVVMTWKIDDIDISDIDRAKFANQIKADAMVSIRCSSATKKNKNGVTVYCSTENNVKKKKYLKNKLLAESILETYTQETGFTNRGVKESDNYPTIKYCRVPIAMIEMGYITNRKDYNRMKKIDFQDKMANGIVNGIEEYFYSIK